jgi:hypothetical protein
MPYRYEKQGDQYVVYKKDSGKRVGATAGNKEALKKYLAALHMNENEELGIKPYEGSMAKSDAALAAQYAYALHKMIQRDIDLPEWIESKITKAKYDLQTATEYMYAELKGLSEDLEAGQNKLSHNVSINTLKIGDVFSINKDVTVDGWNKYKLSAKKYGNYKFLVVKVNPKKVQAVLISPDNKKVVTYRDVLNKAIRFPTSALYDLITSGGHGLPVTPGYETALKTVQRYGLDIPVDPRVGNRKDLRVATFIKNDDIESIRLVELKGLTEDLEGDKKKAAKLRLDLAKLQGKIADEEEKEAAKEI